MSEETAWQSEKGPAEEPARGATLKTVVGAVILIVLVGYMLVYLTSPLWD